MFWPYPIYEAPLWALEPTPPPKPVYIESSATMAIALNLPNRPKLPHFFGECMGQGDIKLSNLEENDEYNSMRFFA